MDAATTGQESVATGVALQGETIYALEYPNADGDNHDDWVPRVRKVGRDGNASTLVTFPRRQR